MAEKKRLPRLLTEEEVRRITSLEPDDITKEKMMELFANFEDKEAQFIPQDYFVLRKDIVNKYANNEKIITQDIDTTIGRYITNLFLFMYNPKILKKIGYVNQTIDKKVIGRITNTIANLILTKEFTVDEFYIYQNKLHWFGFANSSYTTPSINYDIVKPLPDVIKRRNELLKENEEAIANGDVKVSSAIEAELIDLAKKELKDNPAYDLYASGAKVNFGNQYKSMNIMSGPAKDNTTGGYRMITKSFIEGLDKEDVAACGDSLVTGVYSRAVGTQKGGYEGKKMIAAFQTMKLDKKDTDCGSSKYLKVFLTKDLRNYFMYRYIKKGESLVLLDESNIDNYIDTYIQVRSPMYCKGELFCNKCAGEYFYMLGINNIGLLESKVTSVSLNSSLKAFHDQSIHTKEFDWKKYFD